VVVKADNSTAIYEPNVYTILDPRHLTTLQVSTVCYNDRFTIVYVDHVRTSQETPWSSAT
jgi:hypothetical protein